MDYSPAGNSEFPLDDLIQKFSSFKGIGQKTAQRLALEAIMMSSEKINDFSEALLHAKKNIKFCQSCFYLTWGEQCHICLDTSRRQDVICVVAEPKDVLAIEQSKRYQGLFHVLGGVISPLDGMYPELLRFQELNQRVSDLGVHEVILGLSPTVEGDTTALYIHDMLSAKAISIYKLAQGIPIGSDLAYLDEVTIDKAFEGKMKL